MLANDLGYKNFRHTTGASAENLNAILTGQGEMAIAMADSVFRPTRRLVPMKERACHRPAAMMGLWPTTVRSSPRADFGNQDFRGYEGQARGVGAPNSGVELNARNDV
jgi:TRAP-type uncharacterized transport system substrate-binding protein